LNVIKQKPHLNNLVTPLFITMTSASRRLLAPPMYFLQKRTIPPRARYLLLFMTTFYLFKLCYPAGPCFRQPFNHIFFNGIVYMWHATMLETSVYYNVQRNSKLKICLKVNCYRTLYVSE
jgi:hypothetical protein